MVEGIEIGVWQGGKPAGTCFPRTGRDSWAVVFTKTSHHVAHNKSFAYSKYGGKDEAEKVAKAYQFQYAMDHDRIKNRWRVLGPEGEEYVEVHTENRKGEDHPILCDVAALPLIEENTWCTFQHSKTIFYAQTCLDNGTKKLLHQVLHPEWDLVDHIDGNGLDNRESNLRDGGGGVNQRNKAMHRNNTSGVTGVTYFRWAWIGFIRIKGKLYQAYFPGSYESEEAFLAACEWRKERAIADRNENGERV